MVTKYQRPSGVYTGDATLSHREKYQKDSNQEPKVAISSAKMDSDFNYLIDAINDTNTAITNVSAGVILDYAISTNKLNDDSVTTAKLAEDSVTAEKLADNSVGANVLGAGSVTASKLADNSVTNGKIADNSISLLKMMDGSVSSSKIVNENVLSNHLSALAVTGPKIASSAITASKISAGAVTAAKLEVSGVTAGTYTAPTVTVDDKGRVTSATNGSSVDAQQLCKAWLKFNMTNGTIQDSHNISSVEDIGVGTYWINFTNAMGNTDYVMAGMAQNSGTRIAGWGNTTTQAYIVSNNHAGANFDDSQAKVIVIGD
jgi:hypothetical protein